MKHLLTFLLFASSLFAQRGTFSYEKSTSLSSSAETVTVHLPASAKGSVRFIGATVYSSAAATVTLARSGTAPTTTAATVVKVSADAQATRAAVYHTSNVGAGTTIKTYTLSAGEEKGIDLPDLGILPGDNVTISTNSITSNVRIYFQWREY